jgi:MFS family permease
MESFTEKSRRQLILSLKYSTIEACFSVPMLNLTMPSFPFVVVFAADILHWRTMPIGLMTALPYFCNFIQPLLMTFLLGKMSPFRVMILTFTLSALPWCCAMFLPWTGNATNLIFTGILLVATLANCVASVTWSSAISEVVPPHISGRYFGRRNLIFGVWTLIIVFVAGWCVGRANDTFSAFAVVFVAAGLARLVAMLFLSRMSFPKTVMERQLQPASLANMHEVLRDKNYFRLVLFIGVWGLLINAAIPFYTVFLVWRLNMNVDAIVVFTTLASLGGLLTLKAWGHLCDQFGNRPVLQVCATIWAITALAIWPFVGPRWHWQLYPGYFIIGAATAGFQLAQFNLMIKLAPAGKRPAAVAVFLSITSLLTALGPILGGQLLSRIPHNLGQLFEQPETRFQLLFVLSAVGCLIATIFAARIHEPAGQPIENVWRAMRSMKAFNPMLSLQSIGGLMLTPRGLMSLAQRSWRSAQRQARALGEVGGQIVEGGTDVVRKTIFPDDKKF